MTRWRTRDPIGGENVVTDAGGTAVLKSVNSAVIVGVALPTPTTSTRNGIAEAASAQTSTWSTVVRRSTGRSRRPSVSRPAIRREGSDATSAVVASVSMRPASPEGSRSAATGRRTRGSSMPSSIVARSPS